ncbi:hypothetical protein [Amycolatopsis regifaucium]|uniref:Uncharacterized protein n=1 Tax=Amycolatopsis regifaucium TaxID=546365 RepID=A0A154MF68_9PSEU|nr:hypothetical protein [Amycolatopsis regifaucium]KZB82840.1 hypothetical protein AVL48_37415 [Amycolatopsis regifaucium]OKA03768.1 hypothetical protein ATP06_0234600 [Amycolatopsis regifaucium]SFJ59946.1 hypothetical protein SAMN04489731_12618 [Amycolatopsis regifaucium]
MAKTPTLSPDSLAQRAPVRIEIDDDATPLVRLLGRTLRDAVRIGHVPDVLDRGTGTVVVRSHNTPQVATVILRDGAVTVTGGVSAPADATLVVDLEARFAPTQDPDGDAELADGTLRALRPPLPSWREAAKRFWEMTRGIRGIPDVLVAVAQGPDGPQEARFGSGPTTYRMVGTPDTLAGVFTGADYLLTSLDADLRVQGTLSQVSVMTAASWKVRFDV